MTDASPSPVGHAPAKPLKPDAVFLALSNPARRLLLFALFDGQPVRAMALCGRTRKSFDCARKHLESLLHAGLITTEQDTQDSRRRVYTLSPNVKTTTTPEGRTMDFGCCLVRL